MEKAAGEVAKLRRECPRCCNEISDPLDVACDTCGVGLPSIPVDALNAWKARFRDA